MQRAPTEDGCRSWASENRCGRVRIKKKKKKRHRGVCFAVFFSSHFFYVVNPADGGRPPLDKEEAVG